MPAGACLALVGPSGAGKTSLLRVAAGLLRPSSGRVSCGAEVWLDTDRGVNVTPERRRCGYVFQEYALFPHLRTWQNVSYSLRGVSRTERRQRALGLLERFGIAHLAHVRPTKLSGGERQRVAVARALASRPAALLLDEPLSALDTHTRVAAGRELAAVLAAAAVPTLVVTHDFEEAALLGDRIGVIESGRVVQQGDVAELAASPASPFVADLTGAVVLRGAAKPTDNGLTEVALEGGGTVLSAESGEGPVAIRVYPREIHLIPAGGEPGDTVQNRLAVRVESVTPVGGRVRVSLAAPQPLVAELSEASARGLALAPGESLVAAWTVAATRLLHP